MKYKNCAVFTDPFHFINKADYFIITEKKYKKLF